MRCAVELEKEGLKEYILSFFEEKNNDYMGIYLDAHLDRFIETFKLIPVAQKGMRLLDIGSCHETIILFKKFTGYECYFQNYWNNSFRSVHKISSRLTRDVFDYELINFNIEKDIYPFEDCFFDAVSCMEVLEHLTVDPMFLIQEANRVLKINGKLILTTPNIISTGSIQRLLEGNTPYSFPLFTKDCSTNRHNREYTPWEVKLLLEKGGFEVSTLETKDFWSKPSMEIFDLLKKLNKPLDLRGEDIMVVGVKRGTVKERYPVEFYA